VRLLRFVGLGGFFVRLFHRMDSATTGLIQSFLTAEGSSDRLTPQPPLPLERGRQIRENEAAVFVNVDKPHQEFLGIGGALTDAAAEVFAGLPSTQQDAFLAAYFDPVKGIGYSIARISIHSCDFSSRSFTYVTDDDIALGTFSVAPDRAHRLPFIHRVMKAAQGRLLVYASPWSPPAWMKDNGNMLQGGRLRPECRIVWAEYFAKFIAAYEKEGVPIWGLTVQNEPMAVQRWESCIWTAEEERDFVRDHLGPTLARHGMADKRITVWDHNRDLMFDRASVILSDPKAAAFVWGIGFHWYETWASPKPLFSNVQRVAEAFPDKALLFTEGCVEQFDRDQLQSFRNAERYGEAIINDLNHGAVGWTDWNVLLDMQGGPNHVGNFCFAPVHADQATGELHFTPAYYYLGHFSKFIQRSARRLSSVTNRSFLQSVSFINPDGSVVCVVMSLADKPVQCMLSVKDQIARFEMPPHSIRTLLV